ncbi:MAG: DUF2157 domain-containing protein [Alphaproteobacteria bacterium]|nr:DUF2157 domain-containing protein [Alphaproteobacteria bacterium]
MSLNGKLGKWVDAGLITAAQRDAIQEHERKFAGSRWKAGMASSGLLSVVLGLSLIVAANWQFISSDIKLVGHIIINLALSVLVWKWHGNPARKTHAEVALFLLWGLTLTFIALIGQIFQLSGHVYEAIRLWFWITTPMVLLFAQGRYMARLWAVAFIIYVPFDILSTTWDATESWNIRKSVLLGTALLLPLGIWFLGRWQRFASARQEVAATLRRLAVFTALAAASVATLEFYDNFYYSYSVFVPLAFAVLSIALRFALNRQTQFTADDKLTIDLLCLCGLYCTLPFLSYALSDLWAMLHFIALWGLAAAIWQQQGHAKYVSHAVTLISLRIFIGFLEIFGGLMLSGFGFIGIGLLLMGIGWATRKVQARLKGGVS